MKKIVSLLLLAFLFTGVFVNAQTYKFGHIESQRVVIEMEAYEDARDSLNSVRTKYDQQAERMQVEINRKYNELVEQQNTLDSLILESMYGEIQSMQERLQNFQNQATQKLRNLEGQLLEGVMMKLETAVTEVAEELNLIYVFDVSGRNPIYASDQSINVAPMVREKLGIE